MGMVGDGPLDGSIGIVAGVPFDKDKFGPGSHLGYATKNLRDVPRFVARGNNHADLRIGWRRCCCWARGWPRDHEVSQRAQTEWRNPRQIRIAKAVDKRNPQRKKNLLPVADRLKTGEVKDVANILNRQPILEIIGLASPSRRTIASGSSQTRL